ncbi:MAG: hypothetical protein ABIC40_01000 [bacterium]
MLKLLKTELDYWKPVLFPVCGMIILGFIGLSALIISTGQTRINSAFILIFIIIIHLIINLIHIADEYAEKRLYKIATLPISTRQIGITRLLFPAILLLIFIMIFLLYIFGLPRETVLISIRNFTGYSPWSILTFTIGIWVLITYGFRLLTELWGRVLLAILFGIFFLNYFHKRGFEFPDYYSLRYMFRSYHFHIGPRLLDHIALVPLACALFLCIIIAISFSTRKNYMQ